VLCLRVKRRCFFILYIYDQLRSIVCKVLLPIGLYVLLCQAGRMKVIDLLVVGENSIFFFYLCA
jgi:hypothetical protein